MNNLAPNACQIQKGKIKHILLCVEMKLENADV